MKLSTVRRALPVVLFLYRAQQRHAHHDRGEHHVVEDDAAVREEWEHEGERKGLVEGVGGIAAAVAVGLAVLAVADAVRRDAYVWEVAGLQRTLWIALIIGLPIAGPLVYLTRIRPQLDAAGRATALQGG